MTFLYIADIDLPTGEKWAMTLTERMGKNFQRVEADLLTATKEPDGFSQWLQEQAVDLIFIACACEKRIIQRFLNACRSLRIPYIMLTEGMRKLPILEKNTHAIHRILAPVTMLEEEVYKAEILGHLTRYTDCHITLLRPNDYGHRAEQNTQRIEAFLQKQGREVEVEKALKDSMSIYKELPDHQKHNAPDLIVLTASREYGLDDLFFGPPERHVILQAAVPVMLINPRGDLFSLCD